VADELKNLCETSLDYLLDDEYLAYDAIEEYSRRIGELLGYDKIDILKKL
jgi:hypothetical protein